MKHLILAALLLVSQKGFTLVKGDRTTLKLCEGGKSAKVYKTSSEMGHFYTVVNCAIENKLYVLDDDQDNAQFKVVEVLSIQDPKALFFSENLPRLISVGGKMLTFFKPIAGCKSEVFIMTFNEKLVWPNDPNSKEDPKPVLAYSDAIDTGVCANAGYERKDVPSILEYSSKGRQARLILESGPSFIYLNVSSDTNTEALVLNKASAVTKPVEGCGEGIEEIRLLSSEEKVLTFQGNGVIQSIDLDSGEIIRIKDGDLHGAFACPGTSIRTFDEKTQSIIIDENDRTIQRVQAVYDQPSRKVSFEVKTVNY